MLKAYAFGLFTAALGVLLLAALWLGTQPKSEEGLLWGGTVYETREEFNGYLKSRSLSYATWHARNPSASPPWEEETVTIGAITAEASPKNVQLALAGFAWALATAGMILLVRRRSIAGGGLAPTAAAAFSGIMVLILAIGFWQSTQPKEPPTAAFKPPAVEKPEASAASEGGFSRSLLLPGLALGAAVGGGVLLFLSSVQAPRVRMPRLSAPQVRRVRKPRPSRPQGRAPRLPAPPLPVRAWGSAASAGAAVSARRLGGATVAAARSVGRMAPRYGSRVGAVTRDAARLVVESAHDRSIGLNHVAMALFVVAGAIVWGMMVAAVFS